MDTTPEPAINRVVLGRVMQLVEILVVEEVLGRSPLDPIRERLFDSLGCPVGVGLELLEETHVRAESDALSDLASRHLILHLSHHRFIRREARLILGVGRLEVGQVEMLFHLDHVIVDIRRLDVIHQRVGICEKEVGVIHVPRLEYIVVEPS